MRSLTPRVALDHATRARLAWLFALVLACAALSPTLLAPATAHADGAKGAWEVVTREDGVTVSQKEVEGRDLPVFRGATTIPANMYLLLGILSDFDRHKEWMHSCHTAKLLKKIDDYTRISYNRADAPWPVDDREVILHSKVTFNAKTRTIKINFRSTKFAGAPSTPDGVVRMQRLKGYYMLRAKGPNTTYVQYEVDADPGGMIPSWLAAKASSDIPVNTLRNLRKRAKAVAKDYEAFMAKWDPAKNPDAPGPKTH